MESIVLFLCGPNTWRISSLLSKGIGRKFGWSCLFYKSRYLTMNFEFRVTKKQKIVGVPSTSIHLQYNYSSSNLLRLIQKINLMDITTICAIFSNLNASITIRNFPNHDFGIFTDWNIAFEINGSLFYQRSNRKRNKSTLAN